MLQNVELYEKKKKTTGVIFGRFGSWTYDGSKLNLTLSTDSANLDYYLPNPDWDIVSAEAERHVMRYECCPEPYIDVTYQLHLRRKR